MAHYSRVRAPLAWVGGTVVEPSEMEDLDARFGAINGDDGGSWSPTSIITLTGTNGFQSIVLKGGGTVGSPGWVANATNITHNIPTIFNSATTFEALSTFNGDVDIVGFLGMSGDSNNTGTFTNNDAIINFGTITNSGSGKLITGGNDIEIVDDTYFQRTTASLTKSHQVQIGMVTSSSASIVPGLGSNSAITKPGSISFSDVTPASGQNFDLWLILDPNLEYSKFTLALKGLGHSALPLNMPSFELFRVDSLALVTSIATMTVSGVTLVDYDAGFTKDITPAVAFIPDKFSRYILRCSNEFGTNSQPDFTIMTVLGVGTIKTYGRTIAA